MIRNGFLIGAILSLGFISQDALAAKKKFLKFPANFKWCAATAAHQIEGYNYNSDWWEWETRRPGCKVKNCETSEFATDHWNRVDEDIRLMRDLNLKQYRFSVEWAKIEPRENQIDWAAVEHYRQEVNKLFAAGVEPMITLQHFTLPMWVAQKGGWRWAGMPQAFKRYAETVYSLFGSRVRDWVTINEPMVHLGGGYVMGLTPPGFAPSGGPAKEERLPSGCSRAHRDGAPSLGSPTKEDLARLADAVRGVLKSHAAAYHALHKLAKAQKRQIRVGMANHLRAFDPRLVFNPLDWIVKGLFEEFFNWSIPDAMETGRLSLFIPGVINTKNQIIPGLRGTQDFFGLNYYTRDIVWFKMQAGIGAGMCSKANAVTSDMGWEIYPHGIYRLIREATRRYGNIPILITENGIADNRDALRPAYIRSHLKAVHRAIRAGSRVEAYCHWSLLDNFEWVEGYGPRFGLYEVDYATMARIPRASAKLYSIIAAENGLVE